MNNHESIPQLGSPAASREGFGWVDRFACWTIRQAARRTPLRLGERLEEEWLADLESRRGTLSRLRFGIGCCWAAGVIANEHFAASAATASATGSKTMAHYVGEDSSFLSQRATALIVIAGLHLVLFYAFASGLGPKVLAALPQPIIATVTRDVIKREPPPPPSTPDLTRPRMDEIPVPQFKFDRSPEAGTIETVVSSQPPPIDPVQPAAPPKTINRVMGGAGKGFPDSRDFYPAASIRLNETGSTTIHVCVDGTGRLTADPTIVQSSGFTRLDDAAARLARAGSGHYRPTTEDGRPVDSCYPLRITFHLTN